MSTDDPRGPNAGLRRTLAIISLVVSVGIVVLTQAPVFPLLTENYLPPILIAAGSLVVAWAALAGPGGDRQLLLAAVVVTSLALAYVVFIALATAALSNLTF